MITDKLLAKLDRRYESYNALNSSFGFLNKIRILSSQEFCSAATLLQKKYHSNLREDFVDEIEQFKEFTAVINDFATHKARRKMF